MLLKMGQPRPIFCSLLFFTNSNYTENTVGVSGIRTRIIGVEGEHADHHLSTTTAAHNLRMLFQAKVKVGFEKIWLSKYWTSI